MPSGQHNKYCLSAKYETVTLLCHCIDDKYCRRSLVKAMIEELREQVPSRTKNNRINGYSIQHFCDIISRFYDCVRK